MNGPTNKTFLGDRRQMMLVSCRKAIMEKSGVNYRLKANVIRVSYCRNHWCISVATDPSVRETNLWLRQCTLMLRSVIRMMTRLCFHMRSDQYTKIMTVFNDVDVYQFKGCTLHRFCNVCLSYFHQKITIFVPSSSNIRRRHHFKKILWTNHVGLAHFISMF